MKIFFFIAGLLFSMILNAQIEGDWIFTKVMINGETVAEPGIKVTFTADGKMIMMGIEAGTYSYDAGAKMITVHSPMDKKLDGKMSVEKIDSREMIALKDKARLFYQRLDMKKVAKANAKSGLEGVWLTSDGQGNKVYMKFGLPDNLLILKKGEGFSEQTKGEWIFDKKGRSLYILSSRAFIKGNNTVINLKNKELTLLNKGKKTSAVKVDTAAEKEILTFTKKDFAEEQDENKLPWQDSYYELEFLDSISTVVYEENTLLNSINVFIKSSLIQHVTVNKDESNVVFRILKADNGDKVFFDEKNKNSDKYNSFFPMKELDLFKVSGKQRVKLPCGTYQCTVVEGFYDDFKIKYWMIDSMPGVFAKIVIQETEDDFKGKGNYEYKLFVLEKIIRK